MKKVDIVIVGAGPVGLMCAYLAKLCSLEIVIIDKSDKPLQVGRADALNARTLQLLELAGLFDELYPLGKICNTSSVWSKGEFLSRDSSWWQALKGCFHKHFLMIGQAYLEQLLDKKLSRLNSAVRRSMSIKDIQLKDDGCLTTLVNGEVIKSKYLIGADGARSFVRQKFKIAFDIVRPQITWAVIDGIIETDFEKVPEIIVFQSETSDVAWIPREGNIDRFYIRMASKDFSFEDALKKINIALTPYTLAFKEVIWFSRFSVKESVAERFSIDNRVFLAGDACHIHSVNGGQGLNTGLADAFNLIWKLNHALKFKGSTKLLESYQLERKPVAEGVIETSAKLVRSTVHSQNGTHAKDYVKIVESRAGYITGMGIRYGQHKIKGTRLFDLELFKANSKTRLYSLLGYGEFNLLLFSEAQHEIEVPTGCSVIQILLKKHRTEYWCQTNIYSEKAILVRPDAYIEAIVPVNQAKNILE